MWYSVESVETYRNRKYRLLEKYGTEITWTRIMMDQNNHGYFRIFFFLWTYFSGP